MSEHQQDKIKENVPARPQKLELKLLEKKSHVSTDIVSFKFSRSEDNNNYYLKYTAGQYAVFDLGPALGRPVVSMEARGSRRAKSILYSGFFSDRGKFHSD